MGKPGCGKGTQSAMIEKAYHLQHITSGKMLREIEKEDTTIGRKVKNELKDGNLISDDIVNQVLKKKVPQTNYILDGYPRRITQVDTFKDIDLVLLIEISDRESISRILNRKESRSDDTKEIAEKRLKIYHKESDQIINHYKSKGILQVVDGTGKQEDVFARICEIIYKKFGVKPDN